MGANYYTLKGRHIGKLSGAGFYCYACKITLCKQGESEVHSSNSTWYKACPSCGAEKEKNPFVNDDKPRNVSYCSSFTWAIEPGTWLPIVLQDGGQIVGDYEKIMSPHQFQETLNRCPIRFTYLIGREFS